MCGVLRMVFTFRSAEFKRAFFAHQAVGLLPSRPMRFEGDTSDGQPADPSCEDLFTSGDTSDR
jgi:hypothetical protein